MKNGHIFVSISATNASHDLSSAPSAVTAAQIDESLTNTSKNFEFKWHDFYFLFNFEGFIVGLQLLSH